MSDTSGFGKFVPGFEFLQNLAGQAAGGVVQGLEKSIPQLPNLGNWVAPTFNVEDLEKRIEELKAVHFWLDQNTKALSATIQALEVQKMTLATLKTMNFSLGDVANALKIKAADKVAGFAASAPAPTQFAGLEVPPRTYGATMPAPPTWHEPPEDEEDEDEGPPDLEEPPPAPKRRTATKGKKPVAPATPAAGVVDPMQWWGALSQQFQSIAANAMKDVARQTTLDTTRKVASGLTEQAVKTTAGMAGKATRAVSSRVARNVGAAAGIGKAAARAVSSGRRAGASPKPASAAPKSAGRTKKAPAPAQPLSAGDWRLPTGFFPGFTNAPQAPAPAAKAPAVRKTSSPKKPAAAPAATRKRAGAPASAARKKASPPSRRKT